MLDFLLLAVHKSSLETASGPSGPSASFSWAIVGFLTILGLLVTLSPPRRTYEIKKAKDE